MSHYRPFQLTSGSLIFTLLFVCLITNISGQDAPNKQPLTVDEIKTALMTTKSGLATANLILIKQIEEKGISFEIDATIEKSLRDAGAVDDLISSVRERLCDDYSDRADACAKDDFKCQIENYTKALQFHPLDSDILINRGLARHDSGDFQGAIEDYTNALEISPKDSDAYGNRGNSYNRKGEKILALKDYDQAIVLAPGESAHYFNRGALHLYNEEFDLAIRDYSKYIGLKPKQADGYGGRGEAYLESEQYDLAIKDLSTAI